MSLLLDALKKAELAKQQQAAQKGARTDDTTLPAGAESTRTSDRLQNAPSLEPLMTRDLLPEIDASLELVPDQLPSGEPTRDMKLDFTLSDTAAPLAGTTTRVRQSGSNGAAMRAESPKQSSGRRTAEPVSRPWATDVSEDRDSARRLFAAKGGSDINPRRPFYVVLGALAAIAIGAVGYFWWELQPRSSFSSFASNAAKAASRAVAQAPIPTPVPALTAVAQSVAQEVIGVQATEVAPPAAASAVSALPSTAAPSTPSEGRPSTGPTESSSAPASGTASVPTPPDAARPTARAGATANRPRGFTIATADTAPTQAPRRSQVIQVAPAASAKPPVQDAPPIAITRAPARLDPELLEAYAAFQRGEIPRAQQLYLRVAQTDPTNRDAQLGLAAIDVHNQSFTSAEGRYLKLLDLDPRDAHAQAGIAAIRGAGDPVQTESRLKTLLTHQPDAGMLHFALGNQYAVQARWSEAQQSYFHAFTREPENADFAFNLAVSLDQIRQNRVAIEYYGRAMQLAQGRQVAFDRARAEARMKELQR